MGKGKSYGGSIERENKRAEVREAEKGHIDGLDWSALTQEDLSILEHADI